MASTSLRVLFLVSEAEPFVKIGGLGDVGGSLPAAIHNLEQEDVDIRLVIPFHGAISAQRFPITHLTSFDVQHTSGPIRAEVYHSDLEGLPVYLIGGDPIPTTAPVYSNDLSFDAHKYIFFSMAGLELCRNLDWKPDIIHANDWHTAAAIYALSRIRNSDPFFMNTASMLTVHNLPYLGMGANTALTCFGLPPAYDSGLPNWAIHTPMPLGLMSADQIVAVSPTYAKEILTPEFGSGLHEFLLTRQDRITGILNGLAPEIWDPTTDPKIKVKYTSRSLARRNKNKIALQKEFNFEHDPDDNVPLLAMIARMDYQKGVDLTIGALSSMTDIPWQAIILGTGQYELEAAVRSLEKNLPQRVRGVIRFDPGLSRQIYSGSDILLMPSRYEPCGLAQMIAMHYGCVPLARATGGLKDTIFDPAFEDTPNERTGYLFGETTPESMQAALRRALIDYANKDEWIRMQKTGMRQDFSWERSAQKYVNLYRKIIQ